MTFLSSKEDLVRYMREILQAHSWHIVFIMNTIADFLITLMTKWSWVPGNLKSPSKLVSLETPRSSISSSSSAKTKTNQKKKTLPMDTDMDYIKFEESNLLQYLLTVTFLSH